MRTRVILALLCELGACGGASSDQNATPAPDTATPAAPAAQPTTQPMAEVDVTIATDTRSYRAGDPVELRITNKSSRRYTFNPCMRALEREDDSGADKWTEVKEDRMCTMIAHVLEPNSTRNERTELGEEIGPGRYRMVLRFANDAPAAKPQSLTLYTMPFSVTSTR